MSKDKKDKKRRKREAKASTPTLAAQADKYDLYQQSVQEPDHEVAFFDRAYRSVFKRKPRVLREDFCGTFAVCCEWAKKRDRLAIGVDLDPEPLTWGREHNLSTLKPAQQERVILYEADVREASDEDEKADVLAAQNFSFWGFKTREELLAYFEAAYENIADRGVMVMDMMGGPECLDEDHEDVRKYDGFKYVWEQARFDPITHDASFYIHFRFKDGSRLERAFGYHWRFWSIPEVRELLEEAGFSEVHVYWEGTDEDGEGDGNWKRAKTAPSDPAWIAYLVAVKQ